MKNSDWTKQHCRVHKVYENYIDSNGNTHQITMGRHSKQCEAYYRASEKGDKIAMHYLHLPFWETPHYLIKFRMDMIERKCALDRELISHPSTSRSHSSSPSQSSRIDCSLCSALNTP